MDQPSTSASHAPGAQGKTFSNINVSGGVAHFGDYYAPGDSAPLSRLPYAESAPFNSRHRQHDSECTAGTRVSLLADIEEWADANSPSRLFWLNGLAGTGKSTIARTIARRLYKAGRLGASFFFSRGDGDAGSATKFACTIAAQLAQCCPNVRSFIEAAVRQNDRIASLELREQWKKLILDPCSQSRRESSAVIVVVDALDECDTDLDIITVLQILAATACDDRSSLRVLLTSRPDGVIRNSFLEMAQDTRHVFVLHHIEPAVIQGDITTFLRSELASIGIRRGYGAGWVDDGEISKLTRSSGGLFIWAATACRFIADGKQLARKRLQQLTDTSNSIPSHPEKHLDRIYLTVLENSISTYTPDEKQEVARILQQVLGCLIVLKTAIPLGSFSELLGIGCDNIMQALDDLHAILDVPDQPTIPLRIHHPSFRDFLLDARRCSDDAFRIDSDNAHNFLSKACLRLLSTSLRRDICSQSDPTISVRTIETGIGDLHIPPYLAYACLYMPTHSISSGTYLDPDVLYSVLSEHLLHWLEALSWLRRVQYGISVIHELSIFTPVSWRAAIIFEYHLTPFQYKKHRKLSAFLEDAHRFMIAAHNAIATYPLQTYISALLFAPPDSIVRKLFESSLPKWIATPPKLSGGWSPLLHTLETAYDDNYCAAAFSLDDRYLATGPRYGLPLGFPPYVGIWSVDNGSLLYTIFYAYAGTGLLREVCYSPNGTHLAFAHDDAAFQVWTYGVEEDKWKLSISTEATAGPAMPIRLRHVGLHFLPDSRHILAIDSRAEIQLWDIQSRGLVHRGIFLTENDQEAHVTCTALSSGGDWLAVGCADSCPLLWRTADRSVTYLLQANYNTPVMAFVSRDRLSVMSRHGTIIIWDCRIAAEVDRIALTIEPQKTPHLLCPNAAVVNRSERDGYDGWRISEMTVYCLQTGKVIFNMQKFPQEIDKIALSPQQGCLAIADDTKEITLYSTATGLSINHLDAGTRPSKPLTRYLRLHERAASPSPMKLLLFSHSGKILLSVLKEEPAQLWLVRGAVDDPPPRDTTSVSLGIYVNNRQFDLQTPLSSESWHRTVLNLETSGDEWLEAFGQRLVWVPSQYRTSRARGLEEGDTRAIWQGR